MGFLKALKDIFNGESAAASKKEPEETRRGQKHDLKKPSITMTITTHPEDALPSPSLDYAMATRRILNGTTMESTQINNLISLIRENGYQGAWKQKELLGEFFDNQDFDWPWFDEWLERFNAEGFPSNPSWASFADEKLWLKVTILDALKTLKKAELLTLAQRKGISIPPKIKVNDLRELLEKRIKRVDIDQEIKLAESKALTRLKQKQQEDKYVLLALSIEFLASQVLRHKQIANMVSQSKFKYKIQVSPGFEDKICRALAKQWQFNPTSSENLPPFFPGDASSIRAINLDLK